MISMGTTATTKIATAVNRYGDGLESGDIVVTGARWGKCSIGIVPAGKAGRREQDGPMVTGPWGYTVTHAAVIDNSGMAHREYLAAQRVELGELVEIEGLPGTYTFEQRDQRKLEGDGVKLVPADAAARANEARCKIEGELGSMWLAVSRPEVSSLRWRAERAAAAIEDFEDAGGVSSIYWQALEGAKAMAVAASKEA